MKKTFATTIVVKYGGVCSDYHRGPALLSLLTTGKQTYLCLISSVSATMCEARGTRLGRSGELI